MIIATPSLAMYEELRYFPDESRNNRFNEITAPREIYGKRTPPSS